MLIYIIALEVTTLKFAGKHRKLSKESIVIRREWRTFQAVCVSILAETAKHFM